jgi:mRNA interferase MazF
MSTVKRGEIWTIGGQSGLGLRYRVVVLSSDLHNGYGVPGADKSSVPANASPFCAPIVRQRGATELPPYAVALTEQDPITGVVVVNRMRRLPASVGAERIGMVTGASMARLAEAMRGLFEI